MTLFNVHNAFKLELDKLGMSFLPEEIDYWVNTYTKRYVKTRYSGLNTHGTAFQQDQKRSDDLRSIVKSADYSNSTDPATILALDEEISNAYYIEYPSDYWIGLGETIYISYGPDAERQTVKRGDVTECTIENIDNRLTNSLSPHRLHNGVAKPLRLYVDGRVVLYTDGTYTIPNYTLTYLSKPEVIDAYAYPQFNSTNSYTVGNKVTSNGHQYICTVADAAPSSLTNFSEIELTSMPDHTWDEIIAGAVKLALENISDPRYQTYSQESQVIE